MCFPVGSGAGDECDIEAIDLSDFIDIDLRKDDLFRDPEGIISASVKTFIADTAEVADTGDRDRNEAVEKLLSAFLF